LGIIGPNVRAHIQRALSHTHLFPAMAEITPLNNLWTHHKWDKIESSLFD